MNKINFKIDTKKNLLAFSAGVDSSALFFLLIEKKIPFDIAIVDYGQRVQSKDEVIYATQLAHKYKKKCFINNYPKEKKFSEKLARDFRYDFFKDIIKKDRYDSLITAHQLDDKLEWFLMQFTKGAGLSELLSFEQISYQDGYIIHKPLLQYTKKDLLFYLNENNIKYFIDHTNSDEKYKRNYFRNRYTKNLLEDYTQGIKNSFEYLQTDKQSLFKDIDIKKIENLSIYSYNDDLNIAIRLIDKELKKRGLIISKSTRDEILKQKEITISNRVVVSIIKNKIYIAPYVDIKMDKKFKEKCRKDNIPNNIRPYLYSLEIKK
ncbi:MAG: tRNA lysidine(34) synthetase TilS [Campylobacterota bacterium]|nr:tRNA lysidine(34) synthetase TilS [Campylobacterota bacterium]